MKRMSGLCVQGAVFGVLLAAWLGSWLPPAVRETGDLPLRRALPETVGAFTGHEIRYCQNEQCARQFSAPELGAADACPVCGGALSPLSVAENSILPPGTDVVRRRYLGPLGRSVLVTVVLSGADQRGIHRPQRCLPGQGYVLERGRAAQVPRDGRAPLAAGILTFRQQAAAGADSLPRRAHMLYWYAGGARETPSHFARLFWTAFDRLFRRRADRWAFVTVVTEGTEDAEAAAARLVRFVSELYPRIAAAPPGSGQGVP